MGDLPFRQRERCARWLLPGAMGWPGGRMRPRLSARSSVPAPEKRVSLTPPFYARLRDCRRLATRTIPASRPSAHDGEFSSRLASDSAEAAPPGRVAHIISRYFAFQRVIERESTTLVSCYLISG